MYLNQSVLSTVPPSPEMIRAIGCYLRLPRAQRGSRLMVWLLGFNHSQLSPQLCPAGKPAKGKIAGAGGFWW